jgi:hypothetical protein
VQISIAYIPPLADPSQLVQRRPGYVPWVDERVARCALQLDLHHLDETSRERLFHGALDAEPYVCGFPGIHTAFQRVVQTI